MSESKRRIITLAIIILLLLGTIATISAFVENIPDLQDDEEEEEEEEEEESICPTCGAVIPIDSEECPECGEEDLDKYVLTVNIEGEGIVEVEDEEIEDGWTEEYYEGTEVDLEALNITGWEFEEWTGDHESEEREITILMDKDKEVTAHFEEMEKYNLTVNIEGEGVVEVEDEEVEDGWTGEYYEGTEVDLEALNITGWEFEEWTGDHESEEREITIEMLDDKNVTAVFEGDNGNGDNGNGDNGNGDNGNGDNGCCGPGGGDGDGTGGFSIYPEGGYPSDESLFYVKGAQNTSYLKNFIGNNYTGEEWLLGNVSKEEYDGGRRNHEVSNYIEKKENDIDIIPIKEFSPGFIPVSTYTDKVDNATFMDEGELFYYPEPNIFRSNTNFTESYLFSTTKYEFDESTLISADVIEDPRYYQLPDNVTDRTIQLAENITEDIDSEYEKAEAIEQYLKEEYTYDFDYNISPEDHEPVDWFLFEEERGVCTNFNSAFVVLARAVDVPARISSGYRIESTESKQEVKGTSAHAWAEVGLEEAWITFDATPSTGYDDLLETQTNITSIDPEVVQRGENVTVKGEVEAVEGDGVIVDQMPINIYLKENETRIGEGIVEEGEFAINCTIPSEVSVGEYDIIAKSITDNRFIGSWSNDSSENPTSFERKKLTGINPQDIIIISETEIKLDLINQTYPRNEIELNGRLVDDEGDNVTGKNIAVYVEGSYHQNLTTDENGMFSTNLTFQETGSYNVEMMFNGTEFYENSSAEELIEIRELLLEYSTPDIVFRGEDLTIEGKVFLNSTPIKPMPEKEVRISLDGEQFDLHTSEEGFFNHSYPVEKERDVGCMTIEYNLTATDLVMSQEVKIRSHTDIELESVEKTYPGDEVQLKGRLMDDLGENLTGKEIVVFVEGDRHENLTTDDNGTFSTNFTFQETGNYTVEVVFNGTEFYENSKESKLLKLRDPSIVISTSKTWVRGGNASVEGEVRFESEPLSDKEVEIWIEENFFVKISTDRNGEFHHEYQINKTEDLGYFNITYVLPVSNTTKTQQVLIRSEPDLNITFEEEIKGERYEVIVHLTDEANRGVENKIIFLNNSYNKTVVSFVTNESGYATFIFEVPEEFSDQEIVFEANFTGTYIYNRTNASSTLRLERGYSRESLLDRLVNFLDSRMMFFLLPLLIGLTSVGYAWKKGYLHKIFSSLRLSKASKQSTPPPVQTNQKGQARTQMVEYLPEISLPQIDQRLPKVWGVEDDLVIEAKGNVFIDGEVVEFDVEEEEKKRFTHSFTEKGEHEIKAVGPKGVYQETLNIKIVEYREEIKDEYRDLLEELNNKGFEVGKKTTPRKLQRKLEDVSIDERYLNGITKSFERAKYSILDLSRDDYEDLMYGKIEVEKKLERKRKTS